MPLRYEIEMLEAQRRIAAELPSLVQAVYEALEVLRELRQSVEELKAVVEELRAALERE